VPSRRLCLPKCLWPGSTGGEIDAGVMNDCGVAGRRTAPQNTAGVNPTSASNHHLFPRSKKRMSVIIQRTIISPSRELIYESRSCIWQSGAPPSAGKARSLAGMSRWTLGPGRRATDLTYYSSLHDNMTTPPVATRQSWERECLANAWAKTMMTARTVT
jgi:hypothetical protein